MHIVNTVNGTGISFAIMNYRRFVVRQFEFPNFAPFHNNIDASLEGLGVRAIDFDIVSKNTNFYISGEGTN